MSRTQLGLAGILWLVFVAGCAGERGRYAEQSQPAGKKVLCRSGDTPACFERLGKPVRCTCARRDDLVRLLDGD